MTVSNAFSHPDQLSSELRARILAAADTLGYIGPDPVGRALARGSTGAVGVLLTDSLHEAFTDEIATTFLAAIVEELAPQLSEPVLRKVRYDAFYGTHLDHLLRLWGTRTLIVCGTVANICVHYTAASAALRFYDVVVPRDAVSALEPFDLEASLRQTAFLFAGRVCDAAAISLRG